MVNILSIHIVVLGVMTPLSLIGGTSDLEEHIASIFKVEGLGTIFLQKIGTHLLAYTYLQCHKPENHNMNLHCHENLICSIYSVLYLRRPMLCTGDVILLQFTFLPHCHLVTKE
jgi:hypothetical protein